jgi:hypothetical protein
MPKLLLLTLLTLPLYDAAAQTQVPDGCFCLRHQSSRNIQTECWGYKPARGYYSLATCTNEQGGEVRIGEVRIQVSNDWIVIPDGDPGCNPCQKLVGPRRTDELPRGEDGEPVGDAR